MGCLGQDWASYQSATPSTAGLAFAFVKATEGTGYVNPLHAAQVAHARAAGLVVGHYHYPHMATDPAVEAGFFLATAKPQSGDVLVLDWEGYDAANRGVAMGWKVAYKKAWLARVQSLQPVHQVGTYCNTDYLDQDPQGEYGDFLWIATAGRPAGQPGIAHAWLFHQYGTPGGIDRDYCPLNQPELKAWAHAKEDADMALTDAEWKRLGDLIDAKLDAARPQFADATWKIRLVSPTAADPKANTRLAGDFLRFGDQHTADILKALRAQTVPALTPEQIGAIAAQVAANPALASAIAEQVAAKIAARLAQ